MTEAITFLGFGEAGQAIASGMARTGLAISAYDLKLEQSNQGPILRHVMETLQVQAVSLEQLSQAELVVCLVTADQAVAAAKAAAPYLQRGALWLDGNSC